MGLLSAIREYFHPTPVDTRRDYCQPLADAWVAGETPTRYGIVRCGAKYVPHDEWMTIWRRYSRQVEREVFEKNTMLLLQGSSAFEQQRGRERLQQIINGTH